MRTRCLRSIVLAIVPTLTACSNAVVVSAGSRFGFEANAIENGGQHVAVGYKRQEGVLMPSRKSEETCREKPKENCAFKETYPVLSAIHIQTGGLDLSQLGAVEIQEVFLVGQAAVVETAPDGEMVTETTRSAPVEVLKATYGQMVPASQHIE